MIRTTGLALLAAFAASGEALGQAPVCTANPGPLTVYFESGKSELSQVNAQLVQGAVGAALASGCKIAGAVVEAHVDSAEALNPGALDTQRAQSVAAVLQMSGIGAAKIGAFAIGAAEPALKTAAGIAEPMNRRAKVSLVYVEALAAASEAEVIAAKAGEAEKAAQALLDKLMDPSRCGSPAPADRACAAVLYMPRGLDAPVGTDKTTTLRLITAVGPRAETAAATPVTVMIPYAAAMDAFCPMETTVARLARFQLFVEVGPKKSQTMMDFKSVRGWAENEAMGKKDPARFEDKEFKLGRCRMKPKPAYVLKTRPVVPAPGMPMSPQ